MGWIYDYVLITDESTIDEIDGISHALDQRPTAGPGQSDMVLYIKYGQRILGCEQMTDRARMVSAFITPSGLYECYVCRSG